MVGYDKKEKKDILDGIHHMTNTKEQLRQELLKKRNELTREYRQEMSKAICEKLMVLPEFQKSKVIGFYQAMRSEVDLTLAMEKTWEEGKVVVLPRVTVEDRSMAFYEVEKDTPLEKGACGSYEPPTHLCRRIEIKELESIIVPGVAFNTHGYRLGYGGGYFDRFFSRSPRHLFRIGVAYNEQIVPTVLKESFDEKVDLIVTQEETIRCLK